MAGNLRIEGYKISPLENPRQNPRRVFYRPRTGIPTCPLPADPYHTELFLNSGFTLEPPIPQAFVCNSCGKEFTVKIALAGHKRTHKK